jgi:addiction module RelE/StbE family toxin
MADRDAIMDYIARDNPAAAIELDEEFEEKAELARQRPTLYRPGRVRGTREIVVRPNYIMVYRIEDEGATVTLLRVLHTARRWPPASR